MMIIIHYNFDHYDITKDKQFLNTCTCFDVNNK